MKTLKILVLLAGLCGSTAAAAETIEMKVNGLVCGFCAQGIEKAFRRNPATDEIFVSLEQRLVAVSTRPGTDIADEALRRLLKDAGYDLKAIARTERSIAEIRAAIAARP